MKPILKFTRLLPVIGLLGLILPVHADPVVEAIKQRQEKVMGVVQNSSKTVCNLGGIGSGVVVSKDGLILTAAHVIDALDSPQLKQGRGEEFPVTLADGREVKAKSLGRNRNRDAALAQITTPGEYVAAEMADEDTIQQGDWCVAMGHPGGYFVDRIAPVRTGRLWKKDNKAYYRTDCTVSGGDSGGPLFDLNGKVIGIHSSIGERLEENRHVPIGAFKESMERMKNGESWGQLSKLMPELAPFDKAHGPEDDKEDTPPERDKPKEAPAGNKPFLGIGLEESDNGVTITEVKINSPADSAGLLRNDVIHKVDGKEVNEREDVLSIIGSHKPGDKIQISVHRGQDHKEIEVTLGKR